MLEDSSLTAGDMMTRNVVFAHPDTPLRKIARQMLDGGFSGMPVVDDEGKVIGMITEGDLVRWTEEFTPRARWWLDMLADGHDLSPEFLQTITQEHARARAAMSQTVVGVSEDTPIRDVAKLLSERGIKRVPVIRDGRPVGILTRRDLVRALVEAFEKKVPG